MIQRGFRYKLSPTQEQDILFRQDAGVCRLVYNLALEQRRDWWRHYERHINRKLTYVAQARELTALRAEFEWIAAVSQTCQQQALRDLEQAYRRFFDGTAKYPSPRKKRRHESFRFQGRELSVRKLNRRWSQVRLPKIGWVRFRDTRPLAGKINNATVRLEATGWQISFSLSIEHAVPVRSAPAVGIDRGVANTLALSSGERLSLPESLGGLERRKRHAHRMLSRRTRGSRRYAKARQRLAQLQARAARIRRDWHHKTTTDLARRFGTVVLEDLDTRNMTASARGSLAAPGTNVRAKSALNRSILDQGWHIFETLLAYKLATTGGALIKVPPYNTSRTCSACGTVDRQSRKSQARFVCSQCGHRENADINAAVNILRRNTASMLVEEWHRPSGEARTCEIAASL